ncbi:M20 family metallopeptidase [Leucobacter alluvii]|uniref:Peptidase M20 domain-containing protein 2 n=1 Tax=Leucobacter alluvii TaxID=340321 RepID=A0ABN3B2F0_9MICO
MPAPRSGGANHAQEVYLEYQRRSRTPQTPPGDEPSRFAGAGADAHTKLGRSVDDLRPALETLATRLYEAPEIGFAEHGSVRELAAVLIQHGVEPEVGAYGLETALRAQVGTGNGPHFAILAEYDALPGIGHACGHNLIAGIAVGAFLGAAPIVRELGATLSLIGTPAEENGGGKEHILRAGGFDEIHAAAMVHPAAGAKASPIWGERTTGVRRIAVTYRGRAAHAAGEPWLGINALDAVVSAYQSVAQLRQHILPIDRVHGIITDGGAAPNVVPEQASALFYVRSGEIDTLRVLMDRVVDVLRGAALATGTTAEIEVDPVPPYLPLEPSVELMRRWAGALGERGRETPPSPAVAAQAGPSTDMGNVTQFIPAIHPSIGIGGPETVHPHHAAFADQTVQPSAFAAMTDAAAGLGAVAIDYLADGALRAAVDAEFAARGGRYRWES